MKAPELRRVKKILNFYELNFGIRPPYKIIVDGNFVHQALHFNLDFSKQLGRAFIGDDVTPLCTPQIIEELHALGGQHAMDVNLCKTFRIVDPDTGRRISKFSLGNSSKKTKKKQKKVPPSQSKKKSPTTPTPIQSASSSSSLIPTSQMDKHSESTLTPDAQSILKLIGEKNAGRYCVATQNEELRKELRRRGGVPILFLASNRMLWEGASSQSENAAKLKLSVQFGLPLPKGVPLPKNANFDQPASSSQQPPLSNEGTPSPISTSRPVRTSRRPSSSSLISSNDAQFLQELGMDDLITPQDLKTTNNKRKKKWYKPARTPTPKRRKGNPQ